jgi:hypothetical protein
MSNWYSGYIAGFLADQQNKDRSNGTGSLILDLAQKMGMLKKAADGGGLQRG